MPASILPYEMEKIRIKWNIFSVLSDKDFFCTKYNVFYEEEKFV